ncbi:hypothetical protein OU5_0543 [Pseudomonas mandelii JR-1]|uniref:Uncharacterized protein n=1 Tax=Pseudomonas mandelii JR-1 TaxID=1147786 RepID=A0A024E496_9PSED|nr:hypothetical protein OU5_0543 [Pseudomonas mandelii JR-1]
MDPLGSSHGTDRSHALRGNAAMDALRPLRNVTRNVTGCIPTQSAGTIFLKTC